MTYFSFKGNQLKLGEKLLPMQQDKQSGIFDIVNNSSLNQH